MPAYLMTAWRDQDPGAMTAAYERVRGPRKLLVGPWMHLAVPLSAPVLSVLAILNVLQTWNDYIWPLLVIRDNALRTIPLGLVYLKSAPIPDPGAEMASYVLASLPLLVIFVFTMRSFVQGLTSGALKV